MIVVDTNVVAYLLIQGEKTAAARRVYALDADWRLPPLWRAEFLSVLVSSVRAGALTRPQGAKAFAAAASLLARGEMEPSASAVYAAALRFGISAYDAHFAALALNLGASLVTADKALLSRCSGFAVPMESF